ncbi:MAG: PAS domain S-box protein [Rhodoferax sp.]|jgi:two-component system NtrC family sensor kinase|uniref:ATP-binding protein n=1 Tax=Rhodoferax sp. TaxID=50421 RepID=UPI001B43BF10|nr:ATP-binding protein [Rhodoferax sp.]MBP9148592.1 PAS domain S-box protein [Rhodoferax sp.]MBP9735946.1 PAS domain S-box protein [Rhodoferax sp.]
MSDLARLMLDHCPELALLVDAQTQQVLHTNAAVAHWLGYAPEHLSGMQITDIESALQDVFYWEDVRAGRYQELSNQDSEYRRADGELLAVSKSIQRLDHNGQVLLLLLATPAQDLRRVQDTLAQTLSQLRATLESTGNGILVLDWHGHITGMNRHFSRMWALPDALVQAQDDAGVLDFVVAAVQESDLLCSRLGAVVDHLETTDTLHHRDGRVFEFSARPQYLDEQIIGRVFGVQDVTQRTQDAQALRESRDLLEQRVQERTADLHVVNDTLRQEKERLAVLVQELEAAQAQLMQSERMASIGQLAAGVAHEINNPVGFVNSNLGSLQGYVTKLLQLLQAYKGLESVLPDSALTQLASLKQEFDFEFMCEDIMVLLAESLDGLKRVTRIVQDLKNFSHVDESESQLADLEAGLESTLRVVWNELKYKCEVVREFAGVPQISCYPFQLNQVFMNLLVNASQAIETKGRITVRTGFDAQQVWVQVQDTGKGIRLEHLPRIFDPFFSTKPVGKGTGLGLSLSYSIVKKHGGHIDVASLVGQGSTFTVFLPRA